MIRFNSLSFERLSLGDLHLVIIILIYSLLQFFFFLMEWGQQPLFLVGFIRIDGNKDFIPYEYVLI